MKAAAAVRLNANEIWVMGTSYDELEEIMIIIELGYMNCCYSFY
jgi:hypothetical protein